MRSKQQPRPSFRWPQQRGDNIPGEDGVESSGPGTELQGEEGDCADEDGPVSPGETGCSGGPVTKDDEDGEASDEDDDEDNVPLNHPSPSAISARLSSVALRDQAPLDRESMSPRCPSRESRESSGPVTGSPPPPATRSSSSPVSPPGSIVPLPLGVHPLLPPQSAAMMAAYLQQTHQRLLLGHSPLSRSSVSPLVSSSCSPPAATPGLHVSPTSDDVSPIATTLPAVLDFSTRKASSTEEEEDEHILNLSKPPTPSSSTETNNGPLDLSVPSRKRPVPEDSPPPPPRKSSRLTANAPTTHHQEGQSGASPFARQVVSPWTSPVVASHFPYFAAAVAAAATSQQQLSPKGGSVDHQLWNGKIKPQNLDKSYQPSEAAKALEKMSELSKLGGDDLFRSSGGGGGNAGGSSSATSGSRHSAWQSHWLNKGADQAKDVLKCVWCKQSFPTLAAMTTHMKEAKHCGVNMPIPPPSGAMHTPQPHPPPVPPTPPQSHQTQSSSSSGGGNNNSSSNSKQSPSELNLLIKETMPLPRKLVRGQDVWLGKGAEQTRQILKCMWCGQSFRSLAEMTSHMQQTQHYTNIISQEQIISWKSSDESKGGGGSSGGSGGNSGSGGGSGGGAPPGGGSGSHGGGSSGGPGAGATSSHVSAVLTCKVCDQAFSSLKELSNHMVKNSHYKEHIMRSITESGGRRRQTREKRKKSLPVRKLLELERAQNEFKNGDAGAAALAHGLGKHAGRITCEKCGEKIETTIIVDHIRQCIGAGALGVNQRNFLKNALMSNHLPVALPPTESGRKSVNEETSPISSRHHRSPSSASDATTPGKETPTPTGNESSGGTSSPSVLNAIEKLIEKSFDSRIRHGASGMHHAQAGTPIGSSILKRLGIDESVDYTKPLVDPQTMNLLRSYQQQHFNVAAASRRERSGSESSSISERGSGRTDSMTPERRLDLSSGVHDRLSTSSSHSHHPRSTPDKQVVPLPSRHPPANDESEDDESVPVKKEPKDEDPGTPTANDNESRCGSPKDVVVKRELEDGRDDDEAESFSGRNCGSIRGSSEERKDVLSPQMNPPTPRPVSQLEQLGRSPCRNSTSSPTSSDRSLTPRGTPDTKTTSSLGALSSMFDNLSGGGNAANSGGSDGQGRKTSSHPLAALQKLCDKTETRGPSTSSSNRSGSASSATLGSGSGSASGASGSGSGPTPGAILAFSWACNDAVTENSSIMKCAFCDTPFTSKGAYRHHLSKMHFVKDGVIPDSLAIGRSAAAAAAASASSQPSFSGSSHSAASPPASQRNKSPPIPQANGSPSQSAASPLEESPHSKFLKYTELAKQLSSKYV